MKEIFVSGKTLPEAYHQSLLSLYHFGETVACPDYNTSQSEISMTMQVEDALAEPMISKCFIGGYKELEQYRQEIIDGILDFEIEKGNWAYTYHSRMEKQFNFIINELRRNPDSRRAVIDVRDWEVDSKSNDPACMQHIQYFIRDRTLHCKVLFRSNDACKATYMNSFGLIMLQKKIADELDVSVGSFVLRANSFHCYEKDIPMLNGYVSRIINDEDLTYNYIGDWEEMMEEAKPEIAKAVKELKRR
jgi:thymidylate synthase